MKWKDIGKWAFLVGFFGALVAGTLAYFGAFQVEGWYLFALILAGVVIGLLNIKDSESVSLMVAALIIGAGASFLGNLPTVGKFVSATMISLAAVTLPAAIIVAVKTFWKKAKN